MTKIRSDLLKAKDSELRMLAAGATHQHYKGGLYHSFGPTLNTDTGVEDRITYQHYYPHEKKMYHRSVEEWNDLVATPDYHPLFGKQTSIKRFRKLGESW